ncbi:ABC transporter ATP-binding protein [Streptomyces sp. NPDC056390]|uniref:ABC transporter ATP-binding protein n=1 Tax=Streptomyces sp. NPDC056390 TaxID=3345806 RepID=UPI0035DA77EA
MTTPTTPLLSVDQLTVEFRQHRHSAARVVHGVSFDVTDGAFVGIVGESGSGKSVTARTVAGILAPNGVATGSVRYRGQERIGLPSKRAQRRREGIAMIFQNPRRALDPVFTVGNQLVETLRTHDRSLTKQQAVERAADLLAAVGIPDPRRRLRDHPHTMSGGMAQRVAIALALACSPDLLIADEPTSALDVSVQAQILDLLLGLRRDRGTALVFISHDLGAVAELCDDIVVMSGGQIVETGPAHQVISSPTHPYTRSLLNAVPRLRGTPLPADELPFAGPATREPLPGQPQPSDQARVSR